MIVGLASVGICFICALCVIVSRTVYECEKRERKATNLHRFMINLPEMDSTALKNNVHKEKHMPVAYGQMMTMLGKSIQEMDEFKKQLQLLPATVAQKLEGYTNNSRT